MSTVVVGTIATEEFALAHTFEQVPDLTIEAERAVDHGGSVAMPLLWARGTTEEAVTAALHDDPTITSVDLLADVDGKQLYRVAWNEQICQTIEQVLDAQGTLLNVSADATNWRFEVFYPNRGDASMTNGHDVSFSVNRIGQLETESPIRYGLTEKQLDALRTGWSRGYFDVPRAIGIEELSEELGITHQAASERLRRGQSSLIKEAFGLQSGDEETATPQRPNAPHR